MRASRVPGGGYNGALRRLRAVEKHPDDIADVLARISKTKDGERLLAWIHQQTLGRTVPEGAPEGALREHAALHRFATTIFNNVDRGLERNATPPKK